MDIEIAQHEGFVVESQAIVERLVEDLPPEIRKSPLVDRRKRVTNVLYRIVDGKAICTPVKPGPSDLTHTLVMQGIGEGDEVIVGPYKVLESIKHEQLVKTEDDTPAEDETPATDQDAVAAATDTTGAEPGSDTTAQ